MSLPSRPLPCAAAISVCVCVDLTLANPLALVRCHSSPQCIAIWWTSLRCCRPSVGVYAGRVADRDWLEVRTVRYGQLVILSGAPRSIICTAKAGSKALQGAQTGTFTLLLMVMCDKGFGGSMMTVVLWSVQPSSPLAVATL